VTTDRSGGERDVLLDAQDARHLAKYLRAGWKDSEEPCTEARCPDSGHWPGRLRAVDPIREPRWTCVEIVRTGTSGGDPVMRVMFDTTRHDTVILHSVAVRLELRATGRPEWLTCKGEDPRYSICRYMVPVLDWKGLQELIRARGLSYRTRSEARGAPKGAREVFLEIALEDLKVSQEEGPVDMIISKDNPEWMPFPVREELYEQFTLM
jgi:hypothetical protein